MNNPHKQNNDDLRFPLDLDLSLLDVIIHDLFLEQFYRVGEATAKHLVTDDVVGAAFALYPLPVRQQLFPTPQDWKLFHAGWFRPVRLLQAAYWAVSCGRYIVEEYLSSQNKDEDFLQYTVDDIERAFILLSADLSGKLFINEVVRSETEKSTDRAFKVGLETVRRTYLFYLDLVEKLGVEHIAPPMQLRGQEIERHENEALFPDFSRTGIPPEERGFGDVEIDTYHVDVRTRSFTAASAEREGRGSFLGNLSFRLQGAVRSHLNRTATNEPITSPEIATQFMAVLQAYLHPGAEDKPNFPLEMWEKLANITSLQRFSALWTTICIRYGACAIDEFDATGNTVLLQKANWAFSAPLMLSPIWKSDLGTRYVAALGLGEFFLKYKSYLKLTPRGLAQIVHDIFIDVLQTNERLLVISPHYDSALSFQARFDTAIERIIESSALLSGTLPNASALTVEQEALILSDAAKSRILRAEMSLAERVAPNTIPDLLIQGEKSKLTPLRDIRAHIKAVPKDQFVGFEAIDEHNETQDQLLIDLEQIWVQMEQYGEDAQRYVEFRRDAPVFWSGLQWDQFKMASTQLGTGTAIVWFMPVPRGLAVFMLRYQDTSPTLRSRLIKSEVEWAPHSAGARRRNRR